MDFEGNLKEIPNLSRKDYAIQYVNPTSTYTVVKIELDQATNEKRFNCLLNETKLNQNMISRNPIFSFFNRIFRFKLVRI